MSAHPQFKTATQRTASSARCDADMLRRYWAKVDKSDSAGCWNWTGVRTVKGYGLFSSAAGNLRAHRLAWEIANGRPIPDGLLACHSCDNPACVNPAHIWLGTHTDNMRDMSAKGRLVTPWLRGGQKTRLTCRHGHLYSDEGKPKSFRERGWSWCPTCQKANQARNTAKRSARRRAAVESRVDERVVGAAPYPIWLNADAKALLARVVAERPERTKRITENFDGTVAEYGYRGKAASALRAIWNDWFMETSRWVDAAGVGTDLYHKRRNALIAYAEKHSADAVVARELDEQGHGYARKAVAK